MRVVLLLLVVIAGCSSKPSPPVPKVTPPKAAAVAKPMSSIIYGPTLGAPPTAWQVAVSGGPTALLTGGALQPNGYREWASEPGPVAYRVELAPTGRVGLQVIEFSIGQTWGAYGPLASMSSIEGSGTWRGRTLELTPIP